MRKKLVALKHKLKPNAEFHRSKSDSCSNTNSGRELHRVLIANWMINERNTNHIRILYATYTSVLFLDRSPYHCQVENTTKWHDLSGT